MRVPQSVMWANSHLLSCMLCIHKCMHYYMVDYFKLDYATKRGGACIL